MFCGLLVTLPTSKAELQKNVSQLGSLQALCPSNSGSDEILLDRGISFDRDKCLRGIRRGGIETGITCLSHDLTQISIFTSFWSYFHTCLKLFRYTPALTRARSLFCGVQQKYGEQGWTIRPNNPLAEQRSQKCRADHRKPAVIFTWIIRDCQTLLFRACNVAVRVDGCEARPN